MAVFALHAFKDHWRWLSLLYTPLRFIGEGCLSLLYMSLRFIRNVCLCFTRLKGSLVMAVFALHAFKVHWQCLSLLSTPLRFIGKGCLSLLYMPLRFIRNVCLCFTRFKGSLVMAVCLCFTCLLGLLVMAVFALHAFKVH
jgi:hypothetical protein